MRIVLPVVVLFVPALAWGAEISSPQALGCAELATHQSIRLFARTGDGDGAERLMRLALGNGSCRRVPDRERVLASGAAAPGLWVEAADVAP